MFAVCTRVNQKVMPPVLHFMLFTSWKRINFTEVYCNIAEGIAMFRYDPQLCKQSFSTCKQEHVFLHGKSCSSSFAVAGPWCSALPHHWKDQPGHNLMVWGQDCRIGVVTPSIQTLWWPLWCCLVSSQRKQHCRQSSCETNSTKASIRTCVSVQWSEFTVVPLGKKFTRITPFLS